ncbi:MAG: hypothetical protein WCK18_06405 [Prolixibacteraceae bacterium]
MVIKLIYLLNITVTRGHFSFFDFVIILLQWNCHPLAYLYQQIANLQERYPLEHYPQERKPLKRHPHWSELIV